jgi:ribokinase
VALLVLQNEVTPSLNLAAARGAQARGLPVMLNAAPMRTIDPELMKCVTHLIVNAVEAEQMGAEPVADLAGAAAAATRLAGMAPFVVVTAGAAGLAASDKGRIFTLPAERVTVIGTHGAGDAFCGTLAAAVARGLPLEPACLLARRAAADHVAGRTG